MTGIFIPAKAPVPVYLLKLTDFEIIRLRRMCPVAAITSLVFHLKQEKVSQLEYLVKHYCICNASFTGSIDIFVDGNRPKNHYPLPQHRIQAAALLGTEIASLLRVILTSVLWMIE